MMQRAWQRLTVSFAVAAFLTPVLPQNGSTARPGGQPEVLQYEVEWRLVRAGTARLSRLSQANGSLQTDLHLESAGLVSKLYRVNDNYSVSYDAGFCAGATFMRSEEGSRRRETNVTFDREHKKSLYVEKDLIKNNVALQKELDVPPCVHDVVTALNRLRSTKIALGQSVQFPVTDGKRLINAKIEAQEKEKVKTSLGTYQTVRYEAHLFNDNLYVRKGRLFIWLTDDDKRLPVQIRVRLNFPVGTISLQLEKIG
jgi:hypothetical protein